MKYIVICFAFMALTFYELSGGDDFVPRKAELIAAAKAEQDAKEAAREMRLAAVEPDPVVVPAAVSDIALPKAQPASKVVREDIAQPKNPRAAVAVASGALQPTLISLEQSGEMFARPLTQLGAEPEDVRPRMVAQPLEPADMREVAGSRVNMRVGPGTSYGVLTSLPQGTSVEVIDSDGSGWVKLRAVEDDIIGWMAEYLLTEPTG